MTREHRPQNEFHHHQMEMKGLSTREMKETEEKKTVMDQAEMVTETKAKMRSWSGGRLYSFGLKCLDALSTHFLSDTVTEKTQDKRRQFFFLFSPFGYGFGAIMSHILKAGHECCE